MRTIIYGIINKQTREVIFTTNSIIKCTKKLEELENSENYTIAHKWYSI